MCPQPEYKTQEQVREEFGEPDLVEDFIDIWFCDNGLDIVAYCPVHNIVMNAITEDGKKIFKCFKYDECKIEVRIKPNAN